MTWRHPSITYGAVDQEARDSTPPGRRRAAGWAATIIGVGLAASALSLALGGGGLALKAAAALVLELRMARPASHHPPTPHGPPRPVGFCCTTASVAPWSSRRDAGPRATLRARRQVLSPRAPYAKACQTRRGGGSCVGTYKGDAPPPGGDH